MLTHTKALGRPILALPKYGTACLLLEIAIKSQPRVLASRPIAAASAMRIGRQANSKHIHKNELTNTHVIAVNALFSLMCNFL